MSRQFLTRDALKMSVLAAACAVALTSRAAQVDPSELAALTASAKRAGSVAVQVHVLSAGLDRLAADPTGVRLEVTTKTEALLKELGGNALASARWSNNVGQVAWSVTEQGLAILAKSTNAVSFRKDDAFGRRWGLDAPDGRYTDIERRMNSGGSFEVELVPNVAGLDYRTERSGEISYSLAADKIEEARAKTAGILTRLAAVDASQSPLISKLAGATAASLEQPLAVRVSREGLLALIQDSNIRSIRAKGYVDPRPTYFDPEAMTAANTAGEAFVILTLRNEGFGRMLGAASVASQRNSTARDLDDIFRTAGVKSKFSYMSDFGVATGRITRDELVRLQSSGDRRILSVVTNKPLGTVQLSQSTKTINVRKYWDNPGYPIRGNGQNIVIMDTGVDRNHPFFRASDGSNRVVFEACFGSNEPGFVSRCPQPDADGDSPLNWPNSAAPVPNCSTNGADCVHGTHVAGIAAGQTYATIGPNNPPAEVQGIAPDAKIVAVQMFSYPQPVNQRATFYTKDVLKALNAVAGAMDSNSLTNPYTINMSFGGRHPTANTYANGPCDSWPDYSPMVAALNTLYQRGVPVIASTGNDYSQTGIRAPACLSKVIKVAAVLNDSAGTTRANYANVANPDNFPGETFWVAPGGGDSQQGTVIKSSIPYSWYTEKFGDLSGTSQASPHIAGLYALVKGYTPPLQPNQPAWNWTVEAVTQYLKGNAVPVQIDPCLNVVGPPQCTRPTFKLNAIRLP